MGRSDQIINHMHCMGGLCDGWVVGVVVVVVVLMGVVVVVVVIGCDMS